MSYSVRWSLSLPFLPVKPALQCMASHDVSEPWASEIYVCLLYVIGRRQPGSRAAEGRCGSMDQINAHVVLLDNEDQGLASVWTGRSLVVDGCYTW